LSSQSRKSRQVSKIVLDSWRGGGERVRERKKERKKVRKRNKERKKEREREKERE
jgi:hypothetical protein